MPQSPPRKTLFSLRRSREFLYLKELDAVIAVLSTTRNPIRNSSIAILLFTQALQPAELCWLQWRDLNFAENILRVARVRQKPTPDNPYAQVNFQPLCGTEINILQQLEQGRSSDWLLTSERHTRLSERSLHHLIQRAGARADIPFPIHPYMLRRSGLYYRSALLLQPLGLSLRQCCLLWNWNATKVDFSVQAQQELKAIDKTSEAAFLAALKQLQAFSGIQIFENVIDYLLGAYSLFPGLQEIPHDYWLAPDRWL